MWTLLSFDGNHAPRGSKWVAEAIQLEVRKKKKERGVSSGEAPINDCPKCKKSITGMPYSEKAQQAYAKLKNKASGFHPTLKSFFNNYTGLCLYTIIIWIAFWCLGFPSVLKSGFPIITDFMR